MDQIISRATIRALARAAFDRGESRDSHNMNPGATALVDWLTAYDQAAEEWHALQALKGSPP